MAEINLKKNILISGLFRILNMVLILLTSWLSTRYLGVELKGQYSYIITLAGFTWIVLDLGIHKTYPYLIRKEPQQLSALFTWSYILFGVELLVLGSVAFLFLPTWSKLMSFPFTELSMSMFILYIVLSQLYNHMQMFYLGQDKIKASAIRQLIYHAMFFVMVALAFIGLQSIDRLNYILFASIFVTIIIVISYSWNHYQSFSLKTLSPVFLWRSYQMGFKVFFSSLFITLLLRADIVILKKMMGFSSVGIYSLSAHIVDIIQIASNLVGSLLLVKLSDTEDDIQRWILMKRIFIIFFIIIGVVNIGFVFLGRPFIRIVYGAAFIPSYATYLWLIPASFGLSFGSLFNTYLWSKGFPLVSVFLPLAALILNIGLNLLLIPQMGIAGAALASSIAYSLWFCLILLYEQRLSDGKMISYLVPHKEDFTALWSMGQEMISKIFK